MARRTAEVTITEDSPGFERDLGKRFLLTEMAALPAERWAVRVLSALSRSGLASDDDAGGGWYRLAMMLAQADNGESMGVTALMALARMEPADAEPLMAEMLNCIQVMPDPNHPRMARALIARGSAGDDVEEIATLMKLRWEVIELHAGFFIGAIRSRLASMAATAARNSSSTSTSPPPSAP